MSTAAIEPVRNVHRADPSVADLIVSLLWSLGVRWATGVSGGGISRMWFALLDSAVRTLHFRHEAGAVYAAIELAVALRQPVVVFATTGPGLTNLITGVAAARASGATLIVLSGRTSAAFTGRGAVQEVSWDSLPLADVFLRGGLFDEVVALESAEQLPQVMMRLAHGLARPGPFIVHISLPLDVQHRTAAPIAAPPVVHRPLSSPEVAVVDEIVSLLADERFAIWVGRGSHLASVPIRAFVARTGAPVMSTPGGKGTVSEFDRHFLGVTGMGGHDGVAPAIEAYGPAWTIVLGSNLGEASSGFDRRLLPSRGFIHVDIDPSAFGRAFPDVYTIAVQADIGRFVTMLLERGSRLARPRATPARHPCVRSAVSRPPTAGKVRASRLMRALQTVVVDETMAPVLAEAGTSMACVAHHLRFREAGRLRIPDRFGAMGGGVAGVIGAALAAGGPAVCVTGDGALLLQPEISTAAKYGVPAVWVVLNDARYGIVSAGMGRHGRRDLEEAWFPACDFVMMARSMGADGVRVDAEAELESALRTAMASGGPFVVDVVIDTEEEAPFGSRMRLLDQQGGEAA